MARTGGGDVGTREASSSAGLLVLGMHRSGTSALSGVLARCGADVGARVTGGGTGNDTGHWEDATAVELHERLLAAFGARWDDPFPLPAGWQATSDAQRAAGDVAAYVAGNRSRHACWAVKDPRLSLFAGLWREAALAAGQRVASILVLRHPLEVAGSLQARDGIGIARGLLLWYDYTLSALEHAATMPTALVSYAGLLADWRATLGRIRALPGAEGLAQQHAEVEVEAFLQPGRRHQRAATAQRPEGEIGLAWEVLEQGMYAGTAPAQLFERLQPAWLAMRARWQPLADEWRVERRQLWERTARAEALVAADASTLPAHLQAFGQALDHHQAAITEAMTQDLRRMQDAVADAQAAAALVEERRSVAEAGRLAAHEGAQRLREELQAAQASASASAVALAEMHAAAALLEEQRRLADAARLEAEGEVDRLRGELEGLHQTRQRAAALEARLQATETERAHVQAALDHAHAKSWDLGAQLQRIVESRSWRMTRPLRVAMRWMRGEWQPGDAARVRQSLLGAGAARQPASAHRAPPPITAASGPTAHVPAPPLPPAAQGMPDVFVWAVIDWRFRVQRPQHLARALAARGHRVFYLSNEFVDAPAPGFRVDPLDPALPLHQVHLHVPGAPAIYHAVPGRADLEALRASLAAVLGWTCTRDSIGIAQHPYWLPLVRSLPATRVVYDCMDHHGGFDNNAGSVLEAEARLIADADLVVVTSEWLEREVAPRARATATIRNAGEFTHFNLPPRKVFSDQSGRRVIGFSGASAEWFDADLVRAVAEAEPDALVVLVGSDTAGVGASLADLANVRMVGEVPYADLPYWLHGFDVCMLPFKVIPLTLATNPVKVYEYLAAGKPVVSVDLPEMAQFGDCVRIATGGDAFAAAVAEALAGAGDQDAAERRQAFAAGETWGHRAASLDLVLANVPEPRVSVVVLTYNNLAFTQACLFSIEAYSGYANLEVIVVDNASTDDSRGWLRGWAAEASGAGHVRRLILNDENLGFAAGNNVGLREATGEVLVLLNNDTYVTPGWVRGLCNHLRSEPGLGLVGPVTNNIGNEARVEIQYADMVQMIEAAGRRTRSRPGMRLPLATAAFFCVAMRREVHQQVGDLDEQFGVGFFEDDDYCRRVEQAGYGIACAEDVFVHHHLSASFDALKAGRKQALFERNKALYEAKWGEWRPHAYRDSEAQTAE
jgi:GT2 family glycosyltransferase/glycosyltransferase involved in cell wall biosynthesis